MRHSEAPHTSTGTPLRFYAFLATGRQGVIYSEAFFDDVRGTMSLSRKYITHAAFDKLDDQWNGEIEPSVLISNYDAAMHPLVVSGKNSESDTLQSFLETCDVGGDKAGKITKREFENYHANLSASIEKDADFEALMRAVWGLGDGPIQLRAQRAPTEPRIMRFRERSPPPPSRNTFNEHVQRIGTNNNLEENSTDSFVMNQKMNVPRMPQIGQASNLYGGRREIFSGGSRTQRAETSTMPVDTITGKPLRNPPPRVNSAPSSRPANPITQSGGSSEQKSESSILDDVKQLKVKAMLSKNSRNYVQSKVCLDEAYRLMVGLYTNNNVECKKLADQITQLEVIMSPK